MKYQVIVPALLLLGLEANAFNIEDYEDDHTALFLKDIKNMLVNHEAIDNGRTMLVNFTEFGPTSLNIQIYTFTKTVDWAEYLNVQQNVFLKIIDIISSHKAECAFPTRTLHMVEGVAD